MRIALVLTICFALTADAAAGATVVGSATRMIGSDGVRFAAWQDGDVASTIIYDGATARTTRVTPPAGCQVTGIGAGALIATCDAYPLLSSAWVLNLRSGVW